MCKWLSGGREDGKGTVEDVEIEGVDVEPGVVIPPEDVAGGVDVGAGVRREPQLREVGDVAVIHRPGEPDEPAEPLLPLPPGHLLPVGVADVDDPPPAVLLPPHDLQFAEAALRRLPLPLPSLRVDRVGCGGAAGGWEDSEVKEEEEEERISRGSHGGGWGAKVHRLQDFCSDENYSLCFLTHRMC